MPKTASQIAALDRFIYWIKERHKMYVKRKRGDPKPWSSDPVMQSVFFTNPYRENDKTTVWFRENVRGPLRDQDSVFMATVIFRWFNRISTGSALLDAGLYLRWDRKRAMRLLSKLDGPVFTGAYMIKAGVGPGSKLKTVCEAIDAVWAEQDRLVDLCYDQCTLEAVWRELTKFKWLGKFMSYEIVCDLRYTRMLCRASDINTWSNPGPGALRGLLRMEGGMPRGRAASVNAPLDKMIKLLRIVHNRLPNNMDTFELREIEHSLCEWDKYERAREGIGRIKRLYKGT